MPSPRHWSWWRRHEGLLIGLAVCVLLAGLAGYNLWLAGVTKRNDATATKVSRLTAGQCAQTRLLYALLNALAADTSPAFGSPPGRPPVPGARARLIGQLYAAERASTERLAAQGCHVTAPPALPG